MRYLTMVFLALLSLVGCQTGKQHSTAPTFTVSLSDDFASVLQSEIVKAKKKGTENIILPKGTYTISQTVRLVSGVNITGYGETTLQADFVKTGRGGYPVTIFDSGEAGVSDVTLKGITFQSVGSGRKRNISLTKGTANTLRFTNSNNIRLISCLVTDHFSNIPAPYKKSTIPEIVGSIGVLFKGCNGIVLEDVRLRDMQNEAIWFWESDGITIRYMSSVSNGTLSTHLSFWYCNNVSVTDSDFSYLKGGGSSINCESTNVDISNNTFRGGRGLDFSNEGKFQPFTAANVKVSNNVLENVSYYGIMRNRTETSMKNFTVINNQISIKGKTSRENTKVFGIKTDDTENAVVDNNEIIFTSNSPGNHYIAFGSFGFQEVGTTISNNRVRNATHLYWGSTYVGNKANILLQKNDCVLSGEIAGTSAILIESISTAKHNKELQNLTIKGNKIKNLGKRDFVRISSEVPMVLSGLIVSENSLDSKEGKVVLSGKQLSVNSKLLIKDQRGAKTGMLEIRDAVLSAESLKSLNAVPKTIKDR